MIMVGKPKHEILQRMQEIRQDLFNRYKLAALREQLFRDQEGICVICERPMQDFCPVVCSVDHATSVYVYASYDVPIDEACGHANARKNLRAVHNYCNQVKNARDLEEFREQVESGLVKLRDVSALSEEQLLQERKKNAERRDGPRFHRPEWVADSEMFRRFGRRLLRQRVAEYPSLAEFELTKTEADCAILFDYFAGRASYQDIWKKYSKPSSEFVDVGVEEAGDTIQGALQLIAKRSALPVLKVRKANDKIYRAEVSAAISDHYYLPAKLNPERAGTRPLQKYVAELVGEGYRLLRM